MVICIYPINQLRYKLHSLIFKNIKLTLYSWCKYMVMSILDLAQQNFIKIFVFTFTSQISLYTPFTFAKWIFSSTSQSGLLLLLFYLHLLTNWITDQCHRASWWLFQDLKSDVSEHKACLFPLSKEHLSRFQIQLPSSWMFWKHMTEGRSMTWVIAGNSLGRLC